MNGDDYIEMIVDNDTMSRQIEIAMDAIRAEVWHDDTIQPNWQDRLIGQQSTDAMLKLLAHGKDVIEQSGWHPDIAIATEDIDEWAADLWFHRYWLSAVCWSQHCGHRQLAWRLGRVYRLLFGGEPILCDDWVFVPSGRTVVGVANEIVALAFGPSSARRPRVLDYKDSGGAVAAIEQSEATEQVIRDALEEPWGVYVDTDMLELALEAVLFSRQVWEAELYWSDYIFGALDNSNQRLAAALTQLHGFNFGWVYSVNGERVDQLRHGSGHVPDNPTEQQAKAALIEANPLRVEWVKVMEQNEKMSAARVARLAGHVERDEVKAVDE
jgi:hypothetical protein